MQRPSRLLMAITLAAGALAALIDARAASSLPLDEQMRQERVELVVLHIRTARCMHEAAVAGLRNTRDLESVRGFMRFACAGPLRAFLVRTHSLSEADATDLTNQLAAKMLADLTQGDR